MTSLPDHALMTTYLHDLLRRRQITVEHLADLMQPTPESSVRSWIAGHGSPAPADLTRLANALQVDAAELVAAWLIDNGVAPEAALREAILEPLSSSFPRSAALDLIAPARRREMTVEDPHDEVAPTIAARGTVRLTRKVFTASRVPMGAA